MGEQGPEGSARQWYVLLERGVRGLLVRTGARNIQRGIDRLVAAARTLAQRDQLPPQQACRVVYERQRRRVLKQLLARRHHAAAAQGQVSTSAVGRLERLLDRGLPSWSTVSTDGAPDFHCDAGLGGLARWLRAAGYDARYWPGIDDDRLLQLALHDGAILLTTDTRLVQRGVIRWGVIAGLLVPVQLNRHEQFQMLAARLQLPRKVPRCMSCGGELVPVAKEDYRHVIPPRTYPVCNEYAVCARCGKLLWSGTHWERIEAALQELGNS